MDAQDITPDRMAHALFECRGGQNKPHIRKRLLAVSQSLYDDACYEEMREVALSLMSLAEEQSGEVHLRVILALGVTIGLNLAKHLEDIKDLERMMS